jgi:4-hydroxy-3-methylbut-2-enyl diphosphate reductase
MRVIRAGALGYCMGVRRAVELALDFGGRAQGRVYTAGPLIHNQRVLDDLAARGVRVLDDSESSLDGALSKDSESSLAGVTLIIRAHGLAPAAEAAFRARGAQVLDATCPTVKRNQLIARGLYAAGFTVFLAGEKEHAEVNALAAYAPGCLVAGNAAEAEGAARSLLAMQTKNGAVFKTALLAQSTIGRDEFDGIARVIAGYFPGLRVEDTICQATFERQRSLRVLCAGVDAVVIAGDSASANTRRLLALAAECRPAWLVDDARRLPPKVFSYGTVGLSAGASAPPELIDEIEAALTGCP